jgi:hypothetical protein
MTLTRSRFNRPQHCRAASVLLWRASAPVHMRKSASQSTSVQAIQPLISGLGDEERVPAGGLTGC